MQFRSEVAVYNYQAVASKFSAHDTQFNVVRGKINALISESEITQLVNGGGTMYSRLASAEMSIGGISTQISDVQTEINGGGSIKGLKSRLSTVEQTLDGWKSTISTMQTDGVTTKNLVTEINQTDGQINLSVIAGSADLATHEYVGSQITQSAESILLEVSDNYQTADEVASQISMSADAIRLKTTNLAWSSSKSSMTSAGKLTCTEADISGKITATSGSIGGWTINTSSISGAVTSNNVTWTTSINKPTTPTTNVFKVTDGSTTPFRVTAQGKLYATDAEISGKVSATSGAIAGWTIDESNIYKTISGYTTALSAAGTTTTGKVFYVKKDSSYPFYVRADGYVYAQSGSIAGWTLAADGLYKNVGNYEVKLRTTNGGTDAAIRVRNTSTSSNTFYVTNEGKLYAANADIKGKITSTSGNIAGFTLEKYRMKKDLGNYRMYIQGPRNDNKRADGSTMPVSETWYFSSQIKDSTGQYHGKALITATGKADFQSTRVFGDFAVVKPSDSIAHCTITSSGNITCNSLTVKGVKVTGKKNRIVEIDGEYHEMHTFESATPYFMDCGVGTTGPAGQLYEEEGYAQIGFNATFLAATAYQENISGETPYFVFVQPVYEHGQFYVTRLQESFRVVGTPNSTFFWFAFIAQKSFQNEYMGTTETPEFETEEEEIPVPEEDSV